MYLQIYISMDLYVGAFVCVYVCVCVCTYARYDIFAPISRQSHSAIFSSTDILYRSLRTSRT